MTTKAFEIVSKMTLEEKANILSGKNFWETKEFANYGLLSQMLTDGPHGLRKQTGGSDHLGINYSEPATSFPTASLSACSFDPDLMEQMGKALGNKCIRENVSTILGPGVNIKRSPLCGRNFEYFSEDPYLAGKIAAGLIKGIESTGVSSSVKHFAANSQEYARMVNDSIVDERALREIYFPAFEIAVKEGKPSTVMCSYNKINGKYSSNNKWLLTDVLRDEWGYNGIVVTDWGAMDDPVVAVKSGCDLEMPSSNDANAKKIIDAVNSGELSMEDLDKCALRVVSFLLRANEERKASGSDDADDLLAKKIAEESIVLLKNDSNLPIGPTDDVLLVGEMAVKPRYQGAGSSKINPYKLDSLYKAFKESGASFTYVQGYSLTDETLNEALLKAAVNAAKEAKKVIVVAGLPDEYESEGFDRGSMEMPASHNRLIEELSKVNKNITVVLELGSPVTLPWKDSVNAIVLTYLAGGEGGHATYNILTGKVNPSGRLAETWPISESDVPSASYFANSLKETEYRESIFVGYRYYNKISLPVNYPFGYGLSYTQFNYSNLKVKRDAESYLVKVDVTNIGEFEGKEVVQLYIKAKNSKVLRTAPELKAFTKINLIPGETKTVEFKLSPGSFRYYSVKYNKFMIENGEYEIIIGKDSADYTLTESITISDFEEVTGESLSDLSEYVSLSHPLTISDRQFETLLGHPIVHTPLDKKGTFTTSSCLEELKSTLIGKIMVKKLRESMASLAADNADEGMAKMAEAMVFAMPLRAMTMTGAMTPSLVEGIVDLANGHLLSGIRKMK